MADAPERIRVAQDADGFWTCREAVSGSQEYVRADLYAALEAQLAEARKVMELARAVLAQSITAGHNVPGPTPEDIEKAFWALDAALKMEGRDD
jgi:hypothetical protein